MQRIKSVIVWVVALISRYPWAVAIFGFVSGVASFFLVERNQQFAQFIAIIMLVSWVWLILENLLTRGVAHWFGLELPPPLLNFATQLVHQESLFFVIPFFFITTSWNSSQSIFTSLLIIAGIISIVDPIYYRWLAPRRWLYFVFHGVTLFAVLLTALPILFQIPTSKSYLWALIIAVLLSFPSAARGLPLSWWKRSLAILTLVLVAGGIGLWARPWIPPATLWLTQVAVTDRLDDATRSPENELKVITVAQLRGGLYAYTSIHAPRGLNERIYHVWRRNGREVDRIALDISGGREAGYRSWSHKLNFPPYPAGKWQIHVITEANQLIGILRFQVVESLEQALQEDTEVLPVDDVIELLAPPEAIPDSTESSTEQQETAPETDPENSLGESSSAEDSSDAAATDDQPEEKSEAIDGDLEEEASPVEQ